MDAPVPTHLRDWAGRLHLTYLSVWNGNPGSLAMTNHIDGRHYDQTFPAGKWVFDSKVNDVFENMLSRSIPQYETMRDVVFSCGRNFVSPSSTVIDCGASQGGAIAPFVSMSQPPR
jgi:hypothetical protein